MLKPILLVVMCVAVTTVHAVDETFDSNGVKIRYVTEGKGEAVVLIHGWMADSSMWGKDKFGETKLDTKGAEGFQVIAIDCRGHGKSDKPHDAEKYGPEMAEDIVRLLDHLKIDKAHLVGYSSGAFLAGKVAATHPKRVRSIIYAGQAPIIDNGKKPTDAAQIEAFAIPAESGKDMGAYILAMTPKGKEKPTEKQASSLAYFLFKGKDVKAFAAAGRGFKHLGVKIEDLKKCEAPILFLHGSEESDDVKDHVKAVQKLLDRGEIKLIEGGDHITTLMKPAFGEKLMEFLKTGKVK
jgi:pimeloyl-ACP methyl ester carboxylesterase